MNKYAFNTGMLRKWLPPKIILIMKLIVVILTTCLMQVSAAGFAQRLTYVKQNVSLEQVFQEINKQTGYEVLYSNQILNDSKRINADFHNTALDDVLKGLLKGQPLSYEINQKTILIKEKEQTFLEGVVARFQTIDVRGRVLDNKLQPLSGVTVRVKGQNTLVLTDIEGYFYISHIEESAFLIFSYIGFKPVTLAVRKEMGNIILETQAAQLDEVIVNKGYYSENKALSTGSSAHLLSTDIERQPVNNSLLALQGMVAGMEVIAENGIAGGSVNVRIRGINSMDQSREPLYIVDGVPYTSSLYHTPGYYGLGSFGGSGQSPLSLISPHDIESIDILKDADATAIYGTRGANGVVLITTKKGKPGKTSLNINLQNGVGRAIQRAHLMQTPEYLAMRREAFANDSSNPDISNARDLLKWDQNAYTDWQDVAIGGVSKYNDYQLSLSGGNNNTQLLIGSNYHYETTVFPGKYNDRKANVHFNLNSISINGRFKIALTGNYLNDLNSLPTLDFTRLMLLAPNAPSLYNIDGSINWDDFPDNPFKEIANKVSVKTQNLLSNLQLSYRLLPGMELKTGLGFNNILSSENAQAVIASNNPNSGITTGAAVFNRSVFQSWVIEPQLNYTRRIGSGDLGFLIGGTIQRRNIDGQAIIGTGYTDDGLLRSLSGAAEIYKERTVFEDYKYASAFGRLNYSLKDRYVLNVTARRDGSSRFGPGKQFGNFGALGGAWIFSREYFMKNLQSIMNLGKIRVSYGTTGNEPGSNYAFLELYNPSNSGSYGGSLGITPNNLPVPDYRWEVNKKLEIGMELALFNRFNLIAGYFQSKSTNQLVNRPLPVITGFYGTIANLPAKVTNKGWEFTFSSSNLETKNFKWKTNMNFTMLRNRLEDFPNLESSSYRFKYVVGEPLAIRKVYKSAGINSQTGLYQFEKQDGTLTSSPGVRDQSGVVNFLPKFFGGLQNHFSFKRLAIDFHIQFVKQNGENYLFRNSAPPGYFAQDAFSNQPVAVQQRWSHQNMTAAYQQYSQSLEAIDAYFAAGGSDLSFTDASFIKLRNLSISYTFSPKLLTKMKMTSLRIYGQAQNLCTLTNYKGVDPETQSITALPPLRVLTGGIQISL